MVYMIISVIFQFWINWYLLDKTSKQEKEIQDLKNKF